MKETKNELTVFDFNGCEVRTQIINNEPMFCLKDVCEVLGLEQVSRVKDRLKEGGVTTSKVGVQTGIKANGEPAMQNMSMTFINESNLYKTIFQSRKPQAEQFTDWVTSEVLPSIRKTGGYIQTTPEMSNEEIMAKALMVAQETIAKNELQRKMLMQECYKLNIHNKQILIDNNELLEKQNNFIRQSVVNQSKLAKAIKTKAYIASSREASVMGKLSASKKKIAKLEKENNILLGSKKLLTTSQVAKELDYKSSHRLNQTLLALGFIIETNYSGVKVYDIASKYADKGLHGYEYTEYIRSNGELQATRTLKWTQRGKLYLAYKLSGKELPLNKRSELV